MRININIMTGNHFADGTPEVGKIIEEEVSTRDDLDELLDRISDEVDDYFITDEDGAYVHEYDLMTMLD